MELFKLSLHWGLDWEGCSRLCWTDFGRFVTFSQTQWQSFLFSLCWWFFTSQLLSICMREILSTLTSNQKTFFAKIGTTKLHCYKYGKRISWNVWHLALRNGFTLKLVDFGLARRSLTLLESWKYIMWYTQEYLLWFYRTQVWSYCLRLSMTDSLVVFSQFLS